MILATLTSCGLKVPRPEIKSGEFDFAVTYEIGGEIKTVSGVYVCEYDGTKWALDGGSHRAWNAYIKGGMDDLIEIGTAEDGGVIRLHLNFYPEYFMGDPGWSWMGDPEPSITVSIETSEGFLMHENDSGVIEKTYGAKIVSYEYGEPIENTFKFLGIL